METYLMFWNQLRLLSGNNVIVIYRINALESKERNKQEDNQVYTVLIKNP